MNVTLILNIIFIDTVFVIALTVPLRPVSCMRLLINYQLLIVDVSRAVPRAIHRFFPNKYLMPSVKILNRKEKHK